MDINAIQKSYRRYAGRYDFYFGALFQPGRKAVIALLDCQPGDHILEVGVGTGLSLPLYPHDVQVSGIDVSPEMLAKARQRCQEMELKQVELHEMDAEAMSFADHSFDKVVAMYVASVVPHPRQLIAEMARVCRPGGELFIVNHFHSTHPVINRLEKMAAPLSKLMGFRPDFELEEFIQATHLNVVERSPVNLWGYWTLLRAINSDQLSVSHEPTIPMQTAASR